MDRSFLSQPAVIEASRLFVCIRLLTYENAAEAQLLKSLFVGRSGDLENTVFAILKPDGKGVLVKAGRSPSHEFADARQLADTMLRVGRPYGEVKANGNPPLPLLPTLRLALNTAACDQRPLIASVSEDARLRKELEDTLAGLAWSESHRGRFVYVSVSSLRDLEGVKGVQVRSGIVIVQPEQFGRAGLVLAQIGGEATREQLSQLLTQGASLHRRQEQAHREHVREGHRLGVFWETAIPVTDPWERMARERGRTGPPR